MTLIENTTKGFNPKPSIYNIQINIQLERRIHMYDECGIKVIRKKTNNTKICL